MIWCTVESRCNCNCIWYRVTGFNEVFTATKKSTNHTVCSNTCTSLLPNLI